MWSRDSDNRRSTRTDSSSICFHYSVNMYMVCKVQVVCCKIVDCSHIVHHTSVVAGDHCSPRMIRNHPMVIADGTYSRAEYVSAASVRVSARWEGVVRWWDTHGYIEFRELNKTRYKQSQSSMWCQWTTHTSMHALHCMSLSCEIAIWLHCLLLICCFCRCLGVQWA